MKNSDKNAILVSTVKNVKMQDAGEKRNMSDTCMPCVSSSMDSEISYPSMYLNTKQVPALKGLEVEDEVILIIKGKITGYNLNESLKNSRENYDLSIKEIGILDEKEVIEEVD